jgi:peptide/nickel transport system substrate-binding protein
MSRNRWLNVLGVVVALAMLAGCATPTPEVIEKVVTKEVEKVVTEIVEVEKEVTKIVAGTPVVEKVVETKVVEKVVTATPEPVPEKPPRPLVVAQNVEPLTLDPHVNYYGYSKIAQRGMYEPLMQFSKPDENCQFDLVPVLATSWEVSEDNKTWTFNLREGVNFADGTPFNAEAVKWNMDRLLALGQVPSSSLAPVVEETRVVDDLTVEVVLKSPWAPFIRDMSYVLFISPTAAKENEKDEDWGQAWLYEHAVGTGPYLLDEWVHGEQVTVVKNPDYWGGWEGKHIEKVIIKIVPDPTTRKVMLIQGDADVVSASTEDLEDLERAAGVVVEPNCAGKSILTFQMKNRGALADPRVRKAIASVFDYQGFADAVMKGRYQPATGPLTPGAEWGADATLPPYQKDMAKAKELLAEAGYPDGLDEPLEVWINTGYMWFQKDVAEILQAGLAELGIELNIVDQGEFSTFFAGSHNPDVEEGPDIFSWSIETWTGDPDLNLRMYHSAYAPPAGMNGSQYSNPEYDALVDAAAAEMDPDKRMDMVQQLEQILIEDQPAIFVCFINRWFTYNEALKNFYTVYGHVGMWWDYYLEE